MRVIIKTVILLFVVFLALPVQESLPPVEAFHGARILLIPAIVCYAALVLPSAGMFIVAVVGALISDLFYLHVFNGRPEINPAFSLLYFVLAGYFIQGFSPAYERGHWWIAVLLSIPVTSFYLSLQWLFICINRQNFLWGEIPQWRIIGTGLFAGAVVLVFCLIGGAVSEGRQLLVRRGKKYSGGKVSISL